MADGTLTLDATINTAKYKSGAKEIESSNEQVKRSSQDADNATKKIGSGAGESSGKFAAAWSKAGDIAKKALVAGVAAAGVAIVGLGKSAVDAYAAYEQAVGGVDTLFKDSSATVQKYAAQAYKTAGVSANEYMSQITSFSASLIGSLGGDTAKAAEMGNQAIMDMSDNANKMGTDIGTIQQTYQSLARGNYAMLDNLKLGYGGTKAEMARMIKDANAVKKANGEMADLSIDSFADVTEAIHIMQDKMGITGTTAKEAATTIEGSVNMMKAAWKNWLTALANPDADLRSMTQQLIDAAGTVIENVMPVIVEVMRATAFALPKVLSGVFKGLGGEISQILSESFGVDMGAVAEKLAPLQKLGGSLMTLFQGLGASLGPVFGAIGTSLQNLGNFALSALGYLQPLIDMVVAQMPTVQSIITSIMGVLTTVQGVLTSLWQVIMSNIMPVVTQIISTVLPPILAAINAILPYIQQLASVLGTVLTPIISKVSQFIGGALATAFQIVQPVIHGFMSVVQNIIGVLQGIIAFITGVFTGNWGQAWDGIKQIGANVWDAIQNIVQTVIDIIGNIINTVLGKIKEIWGNIWNGIKSVASNVWDGIKSLISNAINAVKSTISNILNGIKSIFSNAWNAVKNGVSSAWDGIKRAVSDGINGMMDFVKGIPGKVKDAFLGAADWLVSAGGDIINGLIKGITGAVGKAVNAVKDAVGNVVDGAKKFLGIGSPSRVFRDQIGQWIPAGLAVGIDANTDDALAAVHDMTNATIDVAYAGLDDLSKLSTPAKTDQSNLRTSSDLEAIMTRAMLNALTQLPTVRTMDTPDKAVAWIINDLDDTLALRARRIGAI